MSVLLDDVQDYFYLILKVFIVTSLLLEEQYVRIYFDSVKLWITDKLRSENLS